MSAYEITEYMIGLVKPNYSNASSICWKLIDELNKPGIPTTDAEEGIRDFCKSCGLDDNESEWIERYHLGGFVKLKDYMDIPFIKPNVLIHPFIIDSSITMISAPPGVYKTFIALQWAVSATHKVKDDPEPFRAENPVGAAYVDGEMMEYDMQNRLKKFTHGRKIIKPFYFWPYTGECVLDLNKAKNRDRLYNILKSHPEIRLLIIDNIQSLFLGLDESDKVSWDEPNAWLLRLRTLRIAIVLIHHTTKTGNSPSGTGARIRNIDTSIVLKRSSGDWIKFIYDKTCRHLPSCDVPEYCIKLVDNGVRFTWAIKITEPDQEDEPKKETVAQIIHLAGTTKLSQKEIGSKVGCTQPNVSKVIKKNTPMLLNKKRNLTVEGKKLYGDDELL